jgi:hypothetical protein
VHDVLINLLASTIFASIAFSCGWFSKKMKDRHSLSYIKRLIGKETTIKIVVSGSHVGRFNIVTEENAVEAIIPENVLSMAMSEGQALAELVSAIHRASRKITIKVIPSSAFQHDGLPFISIGGPSINHVTKQMAHNYFPTYKPRMHGNKLQDDYGFVLSGTHMSTPFILIFGIWTFGAHIGAKCLLSLQKDSDAYKYLSTDRKTMLVAYGVVTDYSIEKHELRGTI